MVLFLLGHFSILTGKPPAGLLTFLIACFTWGVLFGYPAYLCYLKKQRIGSIVVATLFLLVAGLDVAVPLYTHYETEPLLREARPQPPGVENDPSESLKRTTPAPTPPGQATPQWEPTPGGLVEAFLEPQVLAPEYVEQTVRQNKPRSAVEKTLAEDFRADPAAFKKHYDLGVARRKQMTKGESRLEYLVRRAMPVGSAIGNWKRADRYKTALEQFNAGKATQDDIDIIARFEWCHGIGRQVE